MVGSGLGSGWSAVAGWSWFRMAGIGFPGFGSPESGGGSPSLYEAGSAGFARTLPMAGVAAKAHIALYGLWKCGKLNKSVENCHFVM